MKRIRAILHGMLVDRAHTLAMALRLVQEPLLLRMYLLGQLVSQDRCE